MRSAADHRSQRFAAWGGLLWAPIFFFALVFAVAMDYTVFLLATIKEVHDRTGDVREAVVEGLAGTGRVIQPVILRLLRWRAWWMPAWLDRLLPEVRLSHELPETEPTPTLSAASLR